jgi:hypothetical protein
MRETTNRYLRFFLLATSVLLTTFAGSCGGDESPCSPTDPGCGGVPAVQSRTLPVSYVMQRTPVWCWAATADMVLKYYGVTVDQCEIVSTYLQRNCCVGGVGDAFCAVTARSMADIQTALAIGGVRSGYVPRPLTFDEIASEINAGRPMIAGYRGSFSGHVVVITGFDRPSSTIVIYDPYYGVFTVPYAQTFTYNGQLVWAETIAGISR